MKKPYGVVKKLKAIEAADDIPSLSETITSGYSMMTQEPEQI